MSGPLRRVRRFPAPWALALPWVWACASAPDPSMADSTDGPAPECVTGTVVSEGLPVAPRTLVRQEEGEEVELLGTFAGNVRRLTGAVVRACGPGRTPAGALEVTEVAVLEVDGMPALLGVLRNGASGWLLEPLDGGEPAVLAAVPDGLRGAEGEVVWVAGPATEDALTVRSFAVLEGWR